MPTKFASVSFPAHLLRDVVQTPNERLKQLGLVTRRKSRSLWENFKVYSTTLRNSRNKLKKVYTQTSCAFSIIILRVLPLV